MKKDRQLLLAFLVLLDLALFAWAPWITPGYAKQRVEAAFTNAWEGVVDGCGLNCSGCGATGTRKTWFGVQVELEYACGMLPEDAPQYHQRGSAFVSFLGIVVGMPRP